MKLPLQFLDPPAVLPSFHGTGRPRLAETGDRIPLPGVSASRARLRVTDAKTPFAFDEGISTIRPRHRPR